MRPTSRGMMAPGTASGAPPGTASRGGQARPPGTARLRTGVAVSGPGTQAAQGIALQTQVQLSDRPVTGQGMMGMKQTNANAGRLVEDNAYYVGLLRKRVADISTEMSKLNTEIETNSKDSSQYTQLERKYETLLRSKETLEGQLADYNLALDKTRTSTDPEDVKHVAAHIREKNGQAGQELDRIFMLRKQKEQEIAEIEDRIEGQFKSIQNKIDNELEPGKRRAYNELLSRQREFQERNLNSENRLNEINARIRQIEADDKSSSLRKEYALLEKNCQAMRKDIENLQEELDIANLDPKEAHAKFVSRVNDYKKSTKDAEERVAILRDEISSDKQTLENLKNDSEMGENADDTAKYELLVKRDQEMSAFIDSFEETRNGILSEHAQSKDMIVALLEHLSKGLEDSTNLPSQETFGEMEEAKIFKEKNLVTAQKTMESLLMEKKKRENELELLKQSEPRLRKELETLKETMTRMRREMKDFQDLDGLHRDFDMTQSQLSELKQSYLKRKDSIRQQVQVLSAEHESLKKQLNSNDIHKELEETERRLKHYERTIFELREFVESKSRETDYEVIKVNCLKLWDRQLTFAKYDNSGGGQLKSANY